MFQMPQIPALRSKEYLDFVAQEQRDADAKYRNQFTSQLTSGDQQAYRYMLYEMAECWKRPLHVINAACQNPALQNGLYFNVLLKPEDSVEDRQEKREMLEALQTFVMQLPVKTGYSLNAVTGGIQRFFAFCLTQNIIGGHRIDADTLPAYFRVLVENEVFGANELSYDATRIARAATEPARVPPTKDFESLSLMSNEGAAQGRRLAGQLAVDEATPLVQRWVDSLGTRFQFFPTREQLNEVQSFVNSRNLNWLDIASLEKARVALVRRGIFPPRCLELDEIRTIIIDKLDTSDRDSVRIAFRGDVDALKDLMQRKQISIY